MIYIPYDVTRSILLTASPVPQLCDAQWPTVHAWAVAVILRPLCYRHGVTPASGATVLPVNVVALCAASHCPNHSTGSSGFASQQRRRPASRHSVHLGGGLGGGGWFIAFVRELVARFMLCELQVRA
jgi:hypothetical protein